jgi:hypothetical protein
MRDEQPEDFHFRSPKNLFLLKALRAEHAAGGRLP